MTESYLKAGNKLKAGSYLKAEYYLKAELSLPGVEVPLLEWMAGSYSKAGSYLKAKLSFPGAGEIQAQVHVCKEIWINIDYLLLGSA